MTTEKIQKVLARSGYGSRRQMQVWITQGRIQVNSQLATLGDRVSPEDVIYIDGKRAKITPASVHTQVILYNKPEGELSTRHDPEGRATIFDRLPALAEGRWVSVGRLDCNTTGLILFTNDGALAHQLMHPSSQIEREYVVRVSGVLTEPMGRRLTQGVQLEDGTARFEHIVETKSAGSNRWYRVLVVQGRNRVVRRLMASQGLTVNRLKRVRYGPVLLPKTLSLGAVMTLSAEQIEALRAVCAAPRTS